MMIRKLKKVSLVLAGVAAAGGSAQADTKNYQSVETPFEACKKVNIISEEEASTDPNWAKALTDCNGMVQVAPKTGFFVASMQKNTKATAFMTMVAQAAKKKTEANIETLTKMRACFADPNAKDCAKKKADFLASLDSAMDDYRVEMTASLGDTSALRDFVKNSAASKAAAAKDTGAGGNALRSFGDNAAYDATKNPEWNAVTEYVTKRAKEEVAKDKAEAEKAARGDRKAKAAELAKLREARQIKAMDIKYTKMPVLAVLEPTKNFTKDGKPVWTDAQMLAAFDKLLESNKSELAKTDKAIKEGKLEFSRFYDTKKVKVKRNGKEVEEEVTELNMDRFWKAYWKGERDLLDYAMYTPMMEEVLKKHPEYCATATGLSAHLQNKGLQNMAPVIGGTVLALGAGGAVLAPMIGAASGVAITGAQAGALLGLGMGVHDLSRTFSETAEKRDAAVSGLTEAKQYMEAQNSRALSVAMAPLNLMGTSGVGKALYSGIERGVIGKGSKAAQALKDSAMSAAEKTKLTNQAISDVYLKGRAPDEAEANLLAEVLKDTEKRGATTRMDREVALAEKLFENPVKSPQELVARRAARKVFADIPGDVVTGWDDAGFQGFQKVYGEVLADTRKMSIKELEAFEQNQEAREGVFRKALNKLGVSEKSEQDAMIACVFPAKKGK